MQLSSMPSSLDPSVPVSTYETVVINLDEGEEEEKKSQQPLVSNLGKRKSRGDPKIYQDMFNPLVSSIKNMNDGAFHVKATLIGEKLNQGSYCPMIERRLKVPLTELTMFVKHFKAVLLKSESIPDDYPI